MSPLSDRYGRVIDNLRVSVTDRCNLRCFYCMPAEGLEWFDRAELLTFEEIERVVRVFAGLGVHKLRVTGGEPLVRRDLPVLIGKLTRVPGIRDVALTTNGMLLDAQAAALAAAGLRRINVSLDSLIEERFDAMVRREAYPRVIAGLEAAGRVFAGPIKVNVVMIRGTNDDEVLAFARLAREQRYVVRFIEYMPLGADDPWERDRVVPTQEILETISRRWPLDRVAPDPRLPAQRYRFRDGRGEIGFISSVSEPFCEHCNRVRITSDGKLRTCLFSLEETDLKGLLRAGATDTDLREAIVAAVREKEPGHLINQAGFEKPRRTMSQIGG